MFLTGSSAPGALESSGAAAGFLEASGVKIPWVSPAPRGNGIVRVLFNSGSAPLIESYELIRGKAPESREISAFYDSYVKDLTARALADARKAHSGVKPSGDLVNAMYWYPFGCRECEDFLWDGIPDIEKASGGTIIVEEHDTGDPEDFDELLALLEQRGVELRLIPVMFVGNEVLQGDDEIKKRPDGLCGGRISSSEYG